MDPRDRQHRQLRRRMYSASPMPPSDGFGAPESAALVRETVAAHEAAEEAGLSGHIELRPVGSFHHEKRHKSGETLHCKVEVFAGATTPNHESTSKSL